MSGTDPAYGSTASCLRAPYAMPGTEIACHLPSFGTELAYGAMQSFGTEPAYGAMRSFGTELAYGAMQSFGTELAYGVMQSFGTELAYGAMQSFGSVLFLFAVNFLIFPIEVLPPYAPAAPCPVLTSRIPYTPATPSPVLT
eukprot:906033-Rhodomonas_salina.2